MPSIRRSDCVPLPIVDCPVVAVVMPESWVARCVHCVENVACLQSGNILHTVQWNAVGSPDDGHKDARNMLRYYRLPINHYLLHLVGLSFTNLTHSACYTHYIWCVSATCFAACAPSAGRTTMPVTLKNQLML